MSGIFNSSLLKLIRQSMGFSQKEFAEKCLGGKQGILSKYENAVIVPSEETVHRISDFARYPIDFFVQQDECIPSGLIYHRKRNSIAAKLREKIEAEARLRSFDILKICNEFDIHSRLPKNLLGSPEEVARILRTEWNLSISPIQNLTRVLEEHNIVVMKFDFHTDKIDAFFMPLPSELIAIVLNSNPSFSQDRQNFTLAHELGHAILHKERIPSETLEREANAFAAEFLFPAKAAAQEYQSELTLTILKALKGKWKISMQSILFRFHALGLLEDRLYHRFCIYFSSLGFRKSEPPCGIEMDSPSLLEDLMVKYVNNVSSPLSRLHLKLECFESRYPGIALAKKN